MQALAMVAILNHSAARPGAQHKDPHLVVYIPQSQIPMEQLPVHCFLFNLNGSLFITAIAFIVPLL